MSKKLRIDSCDECWYKYNVNSCSHRDEDGNMIYRDIINDEIPSWCPLEDWEGEDVDK